MRYDKQLPFHAHVDDLPSGGRHPATCNKGISDHSLRWKWATKHSVQLLDEYDQIHADLEYFWAIRPSELLEAQRNLETDDGTHTLGKASAKGPIDILELHGGESRAKTQIQLLKPASKHLPPFRATWHAHDGSCDSYIYIMTIVGSDMVSMQLHGMLLHGK